MLQNWHKRIQLNRINADYKGTNIYHMDFEPLFIYASLQTVPKPQHCSLRFLNFS